LRPQNPKEEKEQSLSFRQRMKVSFRQIAQRTASDILEDSSLAAVKDNWEDHLPTYARVVADLEESCNNFDTELISEYVG